MNIAKQCYNAVKCTIYRTHLYYSSYRITRIPLEDKAPLNFKLINEKLLELQEIDSASRKKLMETYDAISDSGVRKVLEDFYYHKLLEKTSNLSLALIPQDYTKIFSSLRKFPKLKAECVQNLNAGVQRLSQIFTTEQIAILLRSYSQIRSRSLKTITGLVETFNKKAKEPEVWELREIASSLASLNIPPIGPVKEFYEKTVVTLPKHLKSMDPNYIAIFVNSFASQSIPQSEILHFVEMNHRKIVGSVYPKKLALILNAFARSNKVPENLLESSSKWLMEIVKDKECEDYKKLNVIDISMIFNAFVRLEHFDQKLFDSFIPWVLEKIDDNTPNLSLVLLVHAYAQCGIKSRDLFSKCAHLLVYRVSQLNPQKLGLVSLSFAKVGYAPPLLFHRIADEIIYRGTIGLKYQRYEFDFKSLEQITQAFSRVGFRDKRIFEVLTKLLKNRFKSNKDEINGEMIASLMVSLSRNKIEGFVPFISDVLEKVKDKTAFSTVSLSKVLNSFDKLKIKNSKLTDKFLKEIRERVNQFQPSVLINTIKALAKLKCYDQHLVKETIKRCSLELTNLSTIDLANIVYALSEFSYRNVTFLKKISICINYQLNNLSKSQLHLIFTRMALLRVSDLELMVKLLEKISAVQHELKEVELAEISMSIIYLTTHFECLNREIARDSGTQEKHYIMPDQVYHTLDHLVALMDSKLDVATVFKLKTIYLYLKNMNPEKYETLSNKSKELLKKADSVQFSLAEYILTSSSVHKEISCYLNMIGITHKNEVQFGPYLIDIVPDGEGRVAIEYDGPSHFYTETLMRNIKSILKHEILTSSGWKVIHIPYQEWAQLVDEKQKIIYLNKIRNEILTLKRMCTEDDK